MSLTAIVKNIPEAKQTVGAQKRLLDYCVQPHKVEVDEQLCFVTGINCMPEFVNDSFLTTQKLWKHKSGTPRFYQYVQSFSPKENVTPEIVHEIGCEFAKKFGNREILVTTHIDREHLHNHFVICAYDLDTGIKYVSGKTHLAELRRESDRICQAHGLTVLPTYNPKKKSTNLGSREYRAAVKGDSWKIRLCADIDFCMRYARSKKEFLRLMRERGYDMRWEDNCKYITYIANVNGEEKRVRDIKLHEENIERRTWRMNSESGKSYLERLKEKNSPPAPPEAPPPMKTVQISEADWERLKDSEWKAEQSIQALQKSMDESAKGLMQTIHELSQTTRKEISQVVARSEEQVGRASERVSDFIWRRAQREDALWWLKLLLIALAVILVILSRLHWGFLNLAT